jgi:mono/diheme cytochrome c family protein
MKHAVLAGLLIHLWLQPLPLLHAQSGPAAASADVEKQGRRIFQQRCAICHSAPLVFSRPYGPFLNKTTVNGREGSVRNTIMEGETGLMPGFRYGLDADANEIKSIIEYLKTVDKPEPPVVNWVSQH